MMQLADSDYGWVQIFMEGINHAEVEGSFQSGLAAMLGIWKEIDTDLKEK